MAALCPPDPSSSFVAVPCPPGPSGPEFDVNQNILCDVGPDGEILGTALAVYKYDEATGAPILPPTFVNPTTGLPYVPLGTLMPCPGEAACLDPVQFCFKSTGSVDNPGRMYDITFDLGIGFAVQSILKDLTEYPVNIVWQVTDPTGTQFATDLQTSLQSLFPGATATVTPGAVDACTGVGTFSAHIECLRLDRSPPTLLQLKYNAGRDSIINPAFLTTPPVADTGGAQFYMRQDNPGSTPFGDSGDVNCTSVANSGWETNDRYGSFEQWGFPGNIYNTQSGTTPTPRGTSVQEINSFGSLPAFDIYGDNPNTIWQTFTVPSAGNFKVKVVVGGRASTEAIQIKLSTGDVNDTGPGDIINTTVFAPQVTTQDPTGLANGTGGPAQPWTTYDNTVPLAAGTYTLAFTGPDKPSGPGGNAFGGLFTDMRVYQDAPGTTSNFVNNDATCTVTSTETSTTCEFWTPLCGGGTITGWRNTADGTTLSNAEFWAQVPAPICCTGDAGGGTSSAGNIVQFYQVCGIVGGVPTELERVVISDQSGGVIQEQFIGPDGAPVSPTSYVIGTCSGGQPSSFQRRLCDDNGTFVRTYTTNKTGQVTGFADSDILFGGAYVPVGIIRDCEFLVDSEQMVMCDDNGPFLFVPKYGPQGNLIRVDTYTLDGSALYFPTVGPIHVCSDAELSPTTPFSVSEFILCDLSGPGQGSGVRFIRKFIQDVNGNVLSTVDLTLNGAPYTVLGTVNDCGLLLDLDDFTPVVLCDDNGPFIRRYGFDQNGGVIAALNLLLDGVTPYVPVGTVDNCPASVVFPAQIDAEEEILNDNNGPFIRQYTYTDGVITGTTNLTLAGAPYVPVGTVTPYPPPIVLPNVAAHHFDVVPGTPWTPAAIPAGRLVGLSYSVVTGTVTTVDADGTSIAGLPLGFTETWNVQDDRETLTPPTSITAAALSRAIVTMNVATP